LRIDSQRSYASARVDTTGCDERSESQEKTGTLIDERSIRLGAGLPGEKGIQPCLEPEMNFYKLIGAEEGNLNYILKIIDLYLNGTVYVHNGTFSDSISVGVSR
jgi:hypothetical protein